MLLIRECRVMTANDGVDRVDILIDDGRIAAIGDRLDETGADVIAGEDRLAIPGLVNAHLHSSEILLRGSYDKVPFDAWGLYVYPLFRPEPLPARVVYLRTALAAIESVRSGVTCVVDDVADETLSLDVLTAVFAAYRDVGLRSNCSGHVMDLEPLSDLPYASELLTQDHRKRLAGMQHPAPAQYREYAEEAIRRFHRPSEGACFVVAPVAPQWLSQEMLETCVEIAHAYDLNLLIHVLETKEQALASRGWRNGGFVEYLDDVGALRPGTTIAHGVWLQDSDLDVLAETGCAVAHNPIANLRLGVGVAPTSKMLDRGIAVGLGTDGLAINDRADLFEVMRCAALVSRCQENLPSSWLGAEDVFHAATGGGARCAYLESRLGTLEVGAPADVVLMRAPIEPLVNDGVVTSVVFSGGPEHVDTVIVDGSLVVRGGVVLGVDEDDIRGELAEFMPFLREWQRGVEAQNEDLRPVLEEIHARTVAAAL